MSEDPLARANDFLAKKEYDRAYEYFEKVLDIDFNNAEARRGSNYLKEIQALGLKRMAPRRSRSKKLCLALAIPL